MKLDLAFDEVFPKSVDAVWRAVTDPAVLARWLMENDFCPRLGHKFKLRDPHTETWRGYIECEVVEFDPPRRMVWSWHGGMDGETTSRVVFELEATAAGTRLLLRHVGDASPGRLDSLNRGWARKLRLLVRVFGPYFVRRAAVPARCKLVFDALSTPAAILRWWPSAETGADGDFGTVQFNLDGSALALNPRCGLNHLFVEWVPAPRTVRSLAIAPPAVNALERLWLGTRAAFELAERSPDVCELEFQHVGLAVDDPALERFSQHWDRVLGSLAAHFTRPSR